VRSRAIRRHHEERMKRRVQKYYSGAHRGDPRRIGILAHSRQLCSCFMCGNPRKWWNEPTRHEKLASVGPESIEEPRESERSIESDWVKT
jgi:hypothetical protein